MINTNISEKTKMHIAGLFAGDGSVSVKKEGKSGRLIIHFNFCYKPILNIISNLLKHGNVTTSKKSEHKIRNFHKQAWVWELYGNDAMKFLKMVLPYLPEKYQQSVEGIKFQEWKNKNIHGKTTTKNQEAYIDKVIETIENLKKQFITVEDIENYDIFKKKHHDPDIECGKQYTFTNFEDDDEYYIRSEKEKELVNDLKKIISPDINNDIIEKMTTESFGGFFDAEGSVRIQKNDSHKNSIYELLLNISNTNFYILEKYCKIFGGSLSDPIINKDKKILWSWSISATDALNFLKTIEPYTLEKNEQIGLAIEFQERRNNNTLTQERAKEIFKRIKDIKNTEYMVNGKTREVPHGYSNVERRKMKEDKELVEKELRDYKELWDEYENNNKNIIYDEDDDNYNCNDNDSYDDNIDKNQGILEF